MTTKNSVSEIDALKNRLAEMEAERQAQVQALKDQIKELNAQAKLLKDQEREERAKLKSEEAKARAKSLAESLKNQEQVSKRNLTKEIQELMLQGKTVDEMMSVLGVERKAILDRRWLIEKRAGLR